MSRSAQGDDGSEQHSLVGCDVVCAAAQPSAVISLGTVGHKCQSLAVAPGASDSVDAGSSLTSRCSRLLSFPSKIKASEKWVSRRTRTGHAFFDMVWHGSCKVMALHAARLTLGVLVTTGPSSCTWGGTHAISRTFLIFPPGARGDHCPPDQEPPRQHKRAGRGGRRR